MMPMVHLEELCVKRYGGKCCKCKRSTRGEALDGAQDDLLYAKAVQCDYLRRVGTSNIRHRNCKRDIDKVGALFRTEVSARNQEQEDARYVRNAQAAQHCCSRAAALDGQVRHAPLRQLLRPERRRCAQNPDEHGCGQMPGQKDRHRWHRGGVECERPLLFRVFFRE
jgi:hypothetical protein